MLILYAKESMVYLTIIFVQTFNVTRDLSDVTYKLLFLTLNFTCSDNHIV